jgi:PIN domain nuclease of toxin-antitoxin system
MSNIYVLDACALLALINNEQGADTVEAVLRDALNGNAVVYMNKINVLEVYYGVYRTEGQVKADETYRRILKQPINIIDTLNDDVFFSAAKLKANYRMSLADSIVLGEAVLRDALNGNAVVYMNKINVEDIKFNWIR